MARDPALPILVVGMDRSGTKLLSNELSRHPAVVSIQHPRHTGIIETNMLTTLVGRFDLQVVEEYVALVEMWASTDFVRQAGVEKEFFYRLVPRPDRCVDLFRALMNEVARRNGVAYWLQKASPQAALAVLHDFPDARWVVIRRDLIGNLRSKVRLSERTGARRRLVRSVLGYVLEDKILEHIARHTGAKVVSFEELIQRPEAVLDHLCRELGLPRAAMGDNDFDRNTSFAPGEDRAAVFTGSQERLIQWLARLASLVPLPILRSVQRLVADPPVLVHGTYGAVVGEHRLL